MIECILDDFSSDFFDEINYVYFLSSVPMLEYYWNSLFIDENKSLLNRMSQHIPQP